MQSARKIYKTFFKILRRASLNKVLKKVETKYVCVIQRLEKIGGSEDSTFASAGTFTERANSFSSRPGNMEEHKRPDICRLCELPAVEGAVQLSRGELDKVSAWLEQKTGHGLCFSDDVDNEEEVEMENCWICQHCFWDARFEHEYSAGSNLMDTYIWWPVNLDDKNYEDYCKAELRRARLVKGKGRSPKGSEKHIGGDESQVQGLKVATTRSPRKRENVIGISSNSKTDSKGRPLSCPYCTRKIKPNYPNVVEHIKTMHARIAIKCKYNQCSSYFKTEDERPEHERKYHEFGPGKMKIWCIYCKRWTPRVSLNWHLRRNHQNVAIRCSYNRQCWTLFKTVAEREMHVREVHQIVEVKNRLPCLYCEKKMCTYNLNRHIKSYHANVAIKCKAGKCGRFFKSQGDLKMHFEQNHASLEKFKIHNCDTCDFKAVYKFVVENHKKEKHGSESFKCNQCSAIFKSKEALKRHWLFSVHGVAKETCPHCENAFAVLKLHMQIKNCNICHQQFPCAGLMKIHKTQCTDERLHECKICGRHFTDAYCFKNHMVLNHKPETYTDPSNWPRGLKNKRFGLKCDECYTYFANKNTLSYHKTTAHFNISNKYQTAQCDLCPKTYSSRSAISLHLEQFHGFRRKNICCFQCSKSFYFQSQLTEHWRKIHGQNEMVECEICCKLMHSSHLRQHKRRFH